MARKSSKKTRRLPGFSEAFQNLHFKNTPSAVSVFPIVVVASRNAAARLEERRVLLDSTLPPDILLPNAKQSQKVKCLPLGQRVMSLPHSATSFNAR